MTPETDLDNPANEEKDRDCEGADRAEACKEEERSVDGGVS